MSGSDFERDTAVRRDADGWTADLQPRWNVGNNPNGGYLLAIAVRAMGEESGRPDPVTVTAHYLSPPADGPVSSAPRSSSRAGRSSRSWPRSSRATASGCGSSAPSVTSPSARDRPG